MARVVIIGGGIAGLAAAHALAARSPGGDGAPPLQVTVIEAAPRLGGKLHTERVDGFLVEAGADSFGTRPVRSPGPSGQPASSSGALDLVEELGLADEVIPTPPKRVLVLRHGAGGGRLQELPRGLHLVVPTDLGEVFRSPLLSLPGKVRVALELARRPPSGRRGRAADGETVAAFLRRHFGRQYTDRIAAPLLAGIHSADPERLSLPAAFPMLAGLEARWGSLIRGAREARAGNGPSRVTLAGGMGTLVEALATQLERSGVSIVTGRPVRALSRGESYRIDLEGGDTLTADGVILAAPPAAGAALWRAGAAHPSSLTELSRLADLIGGLRAIPHTSTATVSLGYPRDRVRHPLDALGFLSPRSDDRAVGACTFASSKFPGRAPEGAVLLRAYVAAPSEASPGGGLPATDAALIGQAIDELTDLLGLAGEPLLARAHRFEAANPRYEPGHRERVAALEAAAPRGLALAGCAYHGVGIPDCIASGRRAAERVLAELAEV